MQRKQALNVQLLITEVYTPKTVSAWWNVTLYFNLFDLWTRTALVSPLVPLTPAVPWLSSRGLIWKYTSFLHRDRWASGDLLSGSHSQLSQVWPRKERNICSLQHTAYIHINDCTVKKSYKLSPLPKAKIVCYHKLIYISYYVQRTSALCWDI